jgi:hypothetical protein
MATCPEPPAIVQLLRALEVEGVRFMLVGMSAANLQGVLASTIDVDIWIGLPPRQSMRVINLCRKLGAILRSANKVYLSDHTPVDFIYEVTGLPGFDREFPRANWLSFHGLKVPVLPLERICRNKQAAGRDKDKLHVLLIRQTLRVHRATKRSRPTARIKRRGSRQACLSGDPQARKESG